MNTAFRLRQVGLLRVFNCRRVFFSKRSFWVYLLAFFPSVIFIGHGIEGEDPARALGFSGYLAAGDGVHSRSDNEENVLKRAGQPIDDSMDNRRGEKSCQAGTFR